MAILHRLQNRASLLMGVRPGDRQALLENLLKPRAGDTVGYWLQLVISVLMATLGLTQGSTAVVIGAMLIAPLMGPIVELGFGLALGSPLLIFRSASRFVGSLLLTLAASAAITRALPFHDLTAELVARTSPTMLDLFIAGACALAALYTTVRSTGETASAAAGTAIGISLVPPLCTAGWGIGMEAWDVAMGAGLLFTANVTAIITITAVGALGLGYGQVDVRALEAGELATEGRRSRARHVARFSERVLGSYASAFFRILVPAAILAAIYVPLRAALSEVAWQSSARAGVREALAPHKQRIVEQAVDIRRGQIRVDVLAIGDRTTNEESLASLSDEIQRRTGARPHIEATYVPDSEQLARLMRSMPTPSKSIVAPAPPPPPGPRFSTTLHELVASRWPARAGALIAVRFVPGPAASVELVHLGPALGPAALDLLTPEVASALGIDVVVVERALPREAVSLASTATPDELAAWAGTAAASLGAAAGLEVVACLEVPSPPELTNRRRAAPPDPTRAFAIAALQVSATQVQRRELSATDRWSLRFAQGPCVVPPATPPPPPEPAAPPPPVTPPAAVTP